MSLSLCSAEFGGRRWACTVSRQYRPASERLVTAHVSIDSFRTTQACLPSIVSRNLPSYRTSTPTDWQRSHSKYSVKPGPLQGAAAVLHSSFAAGERHRHPDSPTISRSIRPHSAVTCHATGNRRRAFLLTPQWVSQRCSCSGYPHVGASALPNGYLGSRRRSTIDGQSERSTSLCIAAGSNLHCSSLILRWAL
jgi:hypothetical protein